MYFMFLCSLDPYLDDSAFNHSPVFLILKINLHWICSFSRSLFSLTTCLVYISYLHCDSLQCPFNPLKLDFASLKSPDCQHQWPILTPPSVAYQFLLKRLWVYVMWHFSKSFLNFSDFSSFGSSRPFFLFFFPQYMHPSITRADIYWVLTVYLNPVNSVHQVFYFVFRGRTRVKIAGRYQILVCSGFSPSP